MKKFKTFAMVMGSGAVLGVGLYSGSSLLLITGVGLVLYSLYKV